jgi:CHAT domain-containing protein/tetratricopeptide (TPR) repeat protein
MLKPVARICVGAFVIFLVTIASPARVIGLELNQARINCRNSTGIPSYMACMQGGGARHQCFAKARQIVVSCMKSAMKAAYPQAPLVSAETANGSTSAKDAAASTAVAKLPIAMVAPPRSVSDITSILDQQKPDAEKIARLNAEADASAPANANSSDLAEFYYKRAQSRALLGRTRESLADAELAIKNGQGADYANVVSRYEQFLARRLFDLEDFDRLALVLAKQKAALSKTSKGRIFYINLFQASMFIRTGDINRAEALVAQNRELLDEARRWPKFPLYAATLQGQVEDGNARLAEARGKYADAESAYHKASIFYKYSLQFMSQWPSAAPKSDIERSADWVLALEGRVKVKEGRVAEGETDVRRALLSQLERTGKFHSDTAGILTNFAYVIQEQGRYREAEQLQRRVIEIYQGLGYPVDSSVLVNAHLFLAQLLSAEGRNADSAKIYDRVDAWTEKWEPSRREAAGGGLMRMIVMLTKGDTANAVEIAQRTLDKQLQRYGDRSLNTAVSRGFLAMALARAGKSAESLQAFKESVPILLSVSDDSDVDGGTTAAAREARTRFVVEDYLRLLSRNPSIAPPNVAEETFGYADVLRGQSVQRALQASSVRSAISDPQLAKLVRASQDGEKEIGAAIATLNNLLALPNSNRDEKALRDTQAQISALHAARAKVQTEIARKFPNYGNLVSPPAPNVADLRKVLTGNEALLSFYFGQFDSFLWVARKDGPVQFAHIPMTLGDLNTKVTRLREALEPSAAMISDIPVFDLASAYELYSSLLKPTESTWKSAKSLIIITNGALGLLPLSLLPTAPSVVKTDDDPLFASYRSVPWLARTHAVTLVPSMSALQTLRKLPPGNASRQQLVAFGDPYFNQEQADDAAKSAGRVELADASNVTRGVPLRRRSSPQLDGAISAQLAQLPRLPDTSEELKSIAIALQSDPAKVLNLGKDANEQKVKSMDLSGFKIIAFATHGLVPGELDGLTQPALALSSPTVSDSDGDGLLTMEEILGLKLDADWVVLSACNTGAGAGAGAEAASGLGRAFFYAGTRALLVTNWSVHSQSARELVTDLFKRQAEDPNLTRGEALRQAMMALADGPGYIGADGKTEFAYAHPLFWAPYSIIGDGGAR